MYVDQVWISPGEYLWLGTNKSLFLLIIYLKVDAKFLFAPSFPSYPSVLSATRFFFAQST